MRTLFTLTLCFVFFNIPFFIARAEQIPVQLSTPQEKFNAGIFVSGAFTVNSEPTCSPAAAMRTEGPKLFLESYQLKFSNQRSVSVGVYSKAFADDLTATLSRLIAAGDQDLKKRHICVGAYDYGNVMNAKSYSAGFILYDPRLVKYMYEELPERSMFSMKQVLFHELAHQFQYWYGNTFSSDTNVRRLELTADCIGAALSALDIDSFSDDLWKISANGIVAAVASLGDFEKHSHGHHGTPTERNQAARAGLDYIRNHTIFLKLQGQLTAEKILRHCENHVKTMK